MYIFKLIEKFPKKVFEWKIMHSKRMKDIIFKRNLFAKKCLSCKIFIF